MAPSSKSAARVGAATIRQIRAVQIRDFLIQFVNEQCEGRRTVLAEKSGLSPDIVYRMLATGKMSKETGWRLQEALPLSYRNEFMQIYLCDFIVREMRWDYAIYWLGQEVGQRSNLPEEPILPRISSGRLMNVSSLPAVFPTHTRSAVRGMHEGRR